MQWTLPIDHSWRSRTMTKYVSGRKAAICGTPEGDKKDWKGGGHTYSTLSDSGRHCRIIQGLQLFYGDLWMYGDHIQTDR